MLVMTDERGSNADERLGYFAALSLPLQRPTLVLQNMMIIICSYFFRCNVHRSYVAIVDWGINGRVLLILIVIVLRKG